MPFLHLVILALVQGITEFLPVSSSGHLVLAHHLMGEQTGWDQDLMIDIAVHIGTLLAVLLYFHKDIFGMITGLKNGLRGHMGVYILIGSLPVIIAGFFIHAIGPAFMRSIEVMAWCTLIFGIVLWIADHFKPHDITLEKMNWKHALFIGFAQILALFPGTSRSGITMTAARWLGYTRTEAARFSLLLAIVAISGAGALVGLDILDADNAELNTDVMIAVGLSFASAMAAIHLLLKWLEKSTFTPFAIYRIILGVALLYLVYSGQV